MIFSIWFLYSFWIIFYTLSNDTKNFHIFGKIFFTLLGSLVTSYHVNTKTTNMSPLFFSLFPHKKHFYEQNMLVTRLLERDYIWVLTTTSIIAIKKKMEKYSWSKWIWWCNTYGPFKGFWYYQSWSFSSQTRCVWFWYWIFEAN